MMPREGIARTPPPAFLFPNQQCQRPDRLAGPTVRCPVAARSGVSSRPRIPCQAVRFEGEQLDSGPARRRQERLLFRSISRVNQLPNGSVYFRTTRPAPPEGGGGGLLLESLPPRQSPLSSFFFGPACRLTEGQRSPQGRRGLPP
jgi:hypothetical protein